MKYIVNVTQYIANQGASYSTTIDNGETTEFFTAEEWNACQNDGEGWFSEKEDSWVDITVHFYSDDADPMFDDPIKTCECTI